LTQSGRKCSIDDNSNKERGFMSLTKKILLGMVLGIFLGCLMNYFGAEGIVKDFVLNGVIELGGRIFISSLKVL